MTAPLPTSSAFRKRPRFDPTEIGLSPDFVLTDYTRLKGCSCKVPQPKLLELLRGVGSPVIGELHCHRVEGGPSDVSVGASCEDGTCGVGGKPRPGNVGMDCSVLPLGRRDERGRALFIVSTTDFFFPSVEDPFLQGQIGAANVLSDLYSMGITRCDTMLMLLAASSDMEEDERYIVTLQCMKGFAERMRIAGAAVTGGQTVINPWPIIGGAAVTVVTEDEMIRPNGLCVGDVLVLTKPLGTQVAVNCKQWLRRPSPIYLEKLRGVLTDEEVNAMYDAASQSMSTLNMVAARLMHTHKAHGATDVTGFGLLGHSINFAEAQPGNGPVAIELTCLPCIAGAVKASRLMGDKYRLLQGLSAETSGGLLVALAPCDADAYKAAFEAEAGRPAWVVGRVVARREGEPFARLSSDVRAVDVEYVV